MKRLLSFFAAVVLLGAQTLQAQRIQTNGPYGGNVQCFAVNGANLFAGTAFGGGVFLSTNNGTSWTATGLTNTNVYAFAVSGTNLFAGTPDGVFLSTNMIQFQCSPSSADKSTPNRPPATILSWL
jgi:hypothetical protein